MDILFEFTFSFWIPAIIIIMGYYIRRNPSKEIGINGYNTILSRKSQEIWDYAQQRAPKYCLIIGYSFCMVNLLSYIICFNIFNALVVLIIEILLGFVSMFTMFYTIENNLRKFKNELS
jgi:uncharacterized membrane protein